jgi:membrane peptidoglycan carboxypeptidase
VTRDEGAALADGPVAAPLPDGDALLAALVLAPATYARNRFFQMFRDPGMRRVRRRASELRSLVRDLARREGAVAELEQLERAADGSLSVRYRVASLNLRVTARLAPTEAAVVEVALARAREEAAPEAAQSIVDGLMIRLSLGEGAQRAAG